MRVTVGCADSQDAKVKCEGVFKKRRWRTVGELMTEQNRNYTKKEIGKFLSDIRRIKGLAEQEYGSQLPITKKLSSMDTQALLQEKYSLRLGP